MNTLDKLLGPRIEHTIDDGEGGEFTVSVRPRRTGIPVTRNTMVSFRRPGERPSKGFGCRVWGLRLALRVGERMDRDPVLESSVRITQVAARNALAWVDTIEAA